MIKVRFAPSPTGFLHLGNGRAAIFNYLFVKKNNGKFVLRIDDTDTERSKPEYETGIYEDLAWLNIKYDEKYKQSERKDLYIREFNKLVEKGIVYPCYETKEELEIMRNYQLKNKKPPVYNRQALSLTEQEKKDLEAKGIKPHWRFKLNRRKIQFDDLIHKSIKFDLGSVSDPVVRKGDGDFTYTFASCVDDIDIGISHIIRGDDHVSNTASQIEIFNALNPEAKIQFGHYPLINFEQSGKMSKRFGDLSIKNFRDQGLEPETIVTFLAKIGTSDPLTTCFDFDTLVSEFDTSKISTSGPKIFLKDMFLLNRKFLASLDFESANTKYKVESEKLWNIIKENIDTPKDIDTWRTILTNGFIGTKIDINFMEKVHEIISELHENDNWSDTFVQKVINEFKENLSTKQIFTNLRMMITSLENGPHFVNILDYLGLDETKLRIEKLLNI